MSEKYVVTGVRKENFFGEYEEYEMEVSKEELINLLHDPKTIVDEAKRVSSLSH